MSRLLAAELSAATRTARFWAMAARNAIPACAVLLLGWPAVPVVLLYAGETWLFFSLRASVEIAFQGTPRDSSALGLGQILGAAARRFLIVGPVFVVVVGLVAWLLLLVTPAERAARGWTRPASWQRR